jgi:hypothetical protein
MKRFESFAVPQVVANRPNRWMPSGLLSLLRLVTSGEEETLQQELARGALPPDLETKLRRLAKDTLLHRFVEQQCRLFAALLLAAWAGSYHLATPADCRRLLRVLAYVRKDDDAIPDYKTGGFADDLQEVRAASTELAPLLHDFKAWHLCHQVPALWLS